MISALDFFVYIEIFSNLLSCVNLNSITQQEQLTGLGMDCSNKAFSRRFVVICYGLLSAAESKAQL